MVNSMEISYKEIILKPVNSEEYKYEAYKGDEKIGNLSICYIDHQYRKTENKDESTINISIRFSKDSEISDQIQKQILIAYLDTLFYRGDYKLIYAQTNSFDKDYVKILKDLGFRVVHRYYDEVEIQGSTYDNMTLKLIPDNFKRAKKQFEEI